MNRRSFFSSVAALGVAASVDPADTLASQARAATGAKTRDRAASLRVAQLTDTHVFHDLNCQAHMRAFLTQFRASAGTPDLVLHTGDVIFDALATERDDVAKQWGLWDELARELPVAPVYAIGNHDVWGKGPTSDPLYGKKWAVDRLKLPNRYYSITKGGWRFIVLDSTHAIPTGWYTAKLDEEQLAWLDQELAQVPATTPIAIVSHIPLLSVALLQWAEPKDEHWTVGTDLMHSDSHAIQAILRRHPNVKLCLSGHLHLLDQVVYDGIAYMGCGAVSGNWWKGDTFHQTHCGFATLDLFADGSFERTYHPYTWPAGSAG